MVTHELRGEEVVTRLRRHRTPYLYFTVAALLGPAWAAVLIGAQEFGLVAPNFLISTPVALPLGLACTITTLTLAAGAQPVFVAESHPVPLCVTAVLFGIGGAAVVAELLFVGLFVFASVVGAESTDGGLVSGLIVFPLYAVLYFVLWSPITVPLSIASFFALRWSCPARSLDTGD